MKADTSEKIAVIHAEGRGSRLKELSLEQPKPMIVVNDVTIISNLIRHLITAKLRKIVIIVGYKAERLKEHLAPFTHEVNLVFVENPIYDKTNNIYSLWLAKDHLKNGFFLFEADVFIEESIVLKFLNFPKENVMLVDKFTPDLNGTVVTLDSSKKVLRMYLSNEQGESFRYSDTYKTVNFYKISVAFTEQFFIKKLDEHIVAGDTGSYYELIIKEAIDNGELFYAFETGNGKWYEIDTREDLAFAKKLFNRS
jgi:choline kinase